MTAQKNSKKKTLLTKEKGEERRRGRPRGQGRYATVNLRNPARVLVDTGREKPNKMEKGKE